MQSNDTDVLFSGTLLGFDESRGTIKTDNEAAGDFRVKSPAVSGLVDPGELLARQASVVRKESSLPQHSLDPCYHFVTGRIGRFVEIDDARANEGFEIALDGSTADRDGGEMSGANEKFAVILEEQWPIAGVDFWG